MAYLILETEIQIEVSTRASSSYSEKLNNGNKILTLVLQTQPSNQYL